MPIPFIIPPGGVTPAVTWQPPAPGEPRRPVPMLAEEIDPETGELLSLVVARDPVDAWVVAQLRIVRASGSAVESAGNTLGSIEMNDAGAEALIRTAIQQLLQPAIDRRDIELVDVQVAAGEQGPAFDMAASVITWKNLRSGQTVSWPSLEGAS